MTDTRLPRPWPLSSTVSSLGDFQVPDWEHSVAQPRKHLESWSAIQHSHPPHGTPAPAWRSAPELTAFSGYSPGHSVPSSPAAYCATGNAHRNPNQSWEKLKGYYFFLLLLSPVSLNEHKYIEIYILFLRFDSSPKNKIEYLQNKTPQTS